MDWENLPSTNTPLNATNLNKITDSGSNANGNYIKYQDGTMICWHVIVGNQFNCTTRYTGISDSFFYQDSNSGAENLKVWTFPQEFYSTSGLVIHAQTRSAAYSMTSIGNLSKTSCSVYCCLPYPVSNVTFNWHLIAIGRWKA